MSYSQEHEDPESSGAARAPLERETSAPRRERVIPLWVAGVLSVAGLALGLGIGLTIGALAERGDVGAGGAGSAGWRGPAVADFARLKMEVPPVPPVPAVPPVAAVPRDCWQFGSGHGKELTVHRWGPGCEK